MLDLRALTYRDFEGVEHNAHDYLMRDGNLGVPGGRYGNDTASCAPIALLLFAAMCDAGADDTLDALDGDMGLVVNSHDEVCWTICNSAHVYGEGFDPLDFFEEEEVSYARELYSDAYCGEEAPF